MITMMYFSRKSDRAITTLVGPGSSPPKSANILAKVGITKTRITPTTITAIDMMVTGYTMAPLICFLSFIAFSM